VKCEIEISRKGKINVPLAVALRLGILLLRHISHIPLGWPDGLSDTTLPLREETLEIIPAILLPKGYFSPHIL